MDLRVFGGGGGAVWAVVLWWDDERQEKVGKIGKEEIRVTSVPD